MPMFVKILRGTLRARRAGKTAGGLLRELRSSGRIRSAGGLKILSRIQARRQKLGRPTLPTGKRSGLPTYTMDIARARGSAARARKSSLSRRARAFMSGGVLLGGGVTLGHMAGSRRRKRRYAY